MVGEVVGIPVGAPATLGVRRGRAGGFARAAAVLMPRSVYHLTGEARHEWEHSIEAMDTMRWPIICLGTLDHDPKSVRKAK